MRKRTPILNSTLSSVEWWANTLAEEILPAAGGFASPITAAGSSLDLLSGHAEAFEAYDAWLAALDERSLGLTRGLNHRAVRTYLGALKKWSPDDSVNPDHAAEAIRGFVTRNAEAKCLVIPKRFQPYMRKRLSHVLRYYGEIRALFQPFRFGPGAVAEKYNQLERWEALGSLHTAPWWVLDLAGSNELLRVSHLIGEGCDATCVLQAVYKQWNKARLITKEPLDLTFGQHAVRHWIRGALACSPETRMLAGSRGDAQAYHRNLAIAGSRTGLLATLDMKDASDRIAWYQVGTVMPCEVMADLDMCRSDSYVISDPPGNHRRVSGGDPLHIFAGMGNATTFIVEGLMFWAACHAVADYHRLGRRFVSVYGDDIVVDAKLASLLIETECFSDFGWVINRSKSMWRPTTRFRESCGIQAFNGEDVTLLRVSGYQSDARGILGVCDFITRAAKAYPAFAERVAKETSIPNIAGAPPGSVSIDLDWLPRTCVETRWVRRYQREEFRLLAFSPQRITAEPDSVGMLYGALSGLLHVDEREISIVDYFHVPVQDRWRYAFDGVRRAFRGWDLGTATRRGNLKHKWVARTDVLPSPLVELGDQFERFDEEPPCGLPPHGVTCDP